MFKIVSRFGKLLGTFPDKETAELWRMHYEDMYGIEDAKIVEDEKEKGYDEEKGKN